MPFSRSARAALGLRDSNANKKQNEHDLEASASASTEQQDSNNGRLMKWEHETEDEYNMRKRSQFRMGVAGPTTLTGKNDVIYRTLDAWDKNRVDPLFVHPSHVEELQQRLSSMTKEDAEKHQNEYTVPKMSKSMIREIMVSNHNSEQNKMARVIFI